MIEPLEFVSGAPSESVHAGGESLWLAPLALGVALILIAGALAVRLIIGWSLRDPSERAFRLLCWRLRVRSGHRALLRELARAHGGASPVALLLSEHAFLTASERAASLRDPPDPRHVLDLENRVFRTR